MTFAAERDTTETGQTAKPGRRAATGSQLTGTQRELTGKNDQNPHSRCASPAHSTLVVCTALHVYAYHIAALARVQSLTQPHC